MEYLYEPLSDRNLQEFMSEIDPKKCNVQEYKNIIKQNNVVKLFNHHNYCIIFLENKESNIGHWVIVYYDKDEPKTVNFFDSYGQDIKKIAPKLVDILFQHFDIIKCNKTRYQELDTAPCGRYCLLIYALSRKSNFEMKDLKKFLNQFKTKKNNTYDLIVCDLVNKDL
jgi:hypothetical protein